jgi:carbon monoxide dehydrogenase subunit G
MIIEQRLVIEAPPEQVWAFTLSIPDIARCLPGLEEIEKVDDDTYAGTVKARVGPIGVRLTGKLTVASRDPETMQAQMNAEAADRKIRGSVTAKIVLRLEPTENGQTAMVMHTDASILGKLGEFGQAVVRRKVAQVMEEFANNLSRELRVP